VTELHASQCFFVHKFERHKNKLPQFFTTYTSMKIGLSMRQYNKLQQLICPVGSGWVGLGHKILRLRLGGSSGSGPVSKTSNTYATYIKLNS